MRRNHAELLGVPEMEEKQKNKKQIEDEFLHSLAKTLCKTEHPELAFNSYSKALKVLYNELYKTYHYANQVKKAFQSQTDYERKAVEYDKKVSEAGFVDERDKEKAKKDLETAKEKAEKSVRTIELREQDANENTTLNRVFNEIKESYRPEISNTVISVDSVKQEEKNKKEDKKYLTQNLSKYNKREQKLISKVYSILQAILPKDMADMVVAKIQEELSK